MGLNLDHQLPFKVDQEAESKSFAVGFRSAWFRCKIKSIGERKRQIWYSMEYFDFPDEKIRWTKVYQKPFQHPDYVRNKSKLELMVRPVFPPFFRKSQQPEFSPTSDVVAIIDDVWKVGDLVDWWYDNCYWSGRVSQLLGEDKVLIDLPKPPIGEGKSYVAYSKDLRPSLDWTPEKGWTVPVPKEHGNFSCVQVIRRNSHETINVGMDIQCDGFLEEKPSCSYTAGDEQSERSSIPTEALPRDDQASPMDSIEKKEDVVSMARRMLLDHSDSPERISIDEMVLQCDGSGKPYFSDSDSDDPSDRSRVPIQAPSLDKAIPMDPIDKIHISSTNHVTSTKHGVGGMVRKRKSSRDHLDSLERMWISETNYTASLRHPDSVESSIIRLEVLAQKIKWLKGLVKVGFEWPNATKQSWKIVENCASLK